MKIKTKKEFFRFLKENNVYCSYIEYAEECSDLIKNFCNGSVIKFIEVCIATGRIEDTIGQAFYWADTKEGFDFWENLYFKLQNENRK